MRVRCRFDQRGVPERSTRVSFEGTVGAAVLVVLAARAGMGDRMVMA
jgi:hypothetical protein